MPRRPGREPVGPALSRPPPPSRGPARARTNRVAPGLGFLARFHVTVGPVQEFGRTPRGHRRIIDITGGHFAGPGFSGEVLSGWADWQIVRPDGSAQLAQSLLAAGLIDTMRLVIAPGTVRQRLHERGVTVRDAQGQPRAAEA